MRLLKGAFDRQTVYSDDPVRVAAAYADAGARRLHIVDLDAARDSGNNRAVVHSAIDRAGIEVQVAGGIRTAADVATWLEAGAAAVVMGTTAIREPAMFAEFVNAFPGKVMAALDVKDGSPAVSGWTQTEQRSLGEVVHSWQQLKLAAIILTSVDRDGTLAGPDLGTLGTVRQASHHSVIYSGGIGSIDEVRAVADAGAAGVILGKALYEGRLELSAALAAVS